MKNEEPDLRDYLKVLKKRRWTVVSMSLAVFLFVLAATFTMTPVYEASSLVYIDAGVATQYTFQQAPYPADNPSYMQTQIGILRSESIARKVVSKMGWDKEPPGRGGPGATLAGMLGFFGVRPKAGPGPETGNESVRMFLKNLSVEALKNSNLVKVSYEDEDPALAARVVNETVKTFVERNLEMKVAPAREAMAWLNDKLSEIKAKMTESSSSLQDFKQDKGLIVTGVTQSNISLQALSDLSGKAIAAESRRYVAEVNYQQVRKLSGATDGLTTLPAVINNTLIQTLKAEEGKLTKEMAEQSKKYGARHPQMIRLKSEVEALHRQMDHEVGLIVTSIKNDYEAALREEQSIKAALARMKGEAMSYERRSTEYELMRQDVDGSKQIYDAVLKKFQESNLMGNISMSSVQLLDGAVPPDKPIKPRKALDLALGAILGLFTGVGFAFLFEYLDNTYKSPEDIEEHLGLPFLGMVPRMKELRAAVKGQAVRLVASNPKSTLTEAFRNIRSSILLSTGDTSPKVIQVCSPIHSEGKSTVSLNLACVMAAAGEKIMLVDADMRKPSLHKALGMPHTKGLSNVLSRQCGLEEAVTGTTLPNLGFISSGPVAPNPGELLGSRKMAEVVETLRGTYDRIIIDCPPCLGLADASILTPLTDGVLMVVRSESTTKEVTLKAVRALDIIKARVLGVVLNDLSSKSESQYYYYYNYNYGHYREASPETTE